MLSKPNTHIRTYGRTNGRKKSEWQFDTTNPPEWFCIAENFCSHKLDKNKFTVLEIGFGMSESLYHMAEDHPDKFFVGIEVYEPAVLKMCKRMIKKQLNNLLIVHGDALFCLQQLEDNTIDRIHVFFPDPWPKKKHHKRRLHRGVFFNYCQNPLKMGAKIHLATDVFDYAVDWIKHKPKNWQIIINDEWITLRHHTKYETRGENLGYMITDLILAKTAHINSSI